MELLRLSLALLLPWLMGVIWLRWRWYHPPQGAWALVLGYGFILGLLVTTAIMRLVDVVGLPQSFSTISVLLLFVTTLGIWLSRDVAWLNWGSHNVDITWRKQFSWERLAFALLLVFLLTRFAGLTLEIYWRPLYPWDAWKIWAVRSQVWFELKYLVPFVDSGTWKSHPGQVYTVEGWHYPHTVSLISTWAALGLGRWDGSLVNFPWLCCAGALGLGFYGQARVWGAAPLISLVFTYLLLSLPLLNTHVALAGYADLWVATVYGLASIAFFQWLRTNSRRQGLLALLLALACVAIKIEGIIWTLTFIPALLMARLPIKSSLAVLVIISVGITIWFFTDGFVIETPTLGKLAVTPTTIEIPVLGRFELFLNIDWWAFIDNFFVFDNWHLFWFLLLAVISVSVPIALQHALLRTYSILILAGFAILGFLFFFTSVSHWASDYTAVNRLFMHMVPVLMFFVFIVVHDRFYTSGAP